MDDLDPALPRRGARTPPTPKALPEKLWERSPWAVVVTLFVTGLTLVGITWGWAAEDTGVARAANPGVVMHSAGSGCITLSGPDAVEGRFCLSSPRQSKN